MAFAIRDALNVEHSKQCFHELPQSSYIKTSLPKNRTG